MHTEIHNAVTAADQGTQYDESAKRLLGQKSILSQILVRTVDEFKGMNPRYVETLIEGEPYISRIPLEPGLTNQEHAEGLVRFDIVFYVRMKDGLSQIIINVEAQKDEPQRYGILNRAVFYVSRLISSQKYHKRRIRYTDRTDNRAGGGYYVQSESGNKRSWNSGRPGRGNY